MKKYTILALALAICGAMLVGCGCSGNGTDMTTVPTTAPTTAATTTPATQATTTPQTEPTAMDGSTSETAGDDGLIDTNPADTSGIEGSGKTRSNRQIPPLG